LVYIKHGFMRLVQFPANRSQPYSITIEPIPWLFWNSTAKWVDLKQLNPIYADRNEYVPVEEVEMFVICEKPFELSKEICYNRI